MERYDNVIAEIKLPTDDLKITSIQEVLKLAKENSNQNKEFWNQVSDILWNHLHEGFKKFDDQLLSATCFYTVITLTDNQDFYLAEVLQIINKELFIKQNNVEKPTNTYFVVSMMYGIFQSTFLIQRAHKDDSKIVLVLKSIFDLLLLLGYDYSQYTFICFKIMKLYKKVCGTNLQECIFNKENQIKLLIFVNHNWENPVSGIRDLNRSIFQTLLFILSDDMNVYVLKEINGFYWNKGKYLMLSEIIEHQNKNLFSLVHKNKWADGLIHSLYKPGLVSAGADMYYALLKQMNFEDDWCKIFLQPIINVLNGTSSKAIENFNNFWCLPTLKKFPTITNRLIDELKALNGSEQNLCSLLWLMKQANRLGLIEKNWNVTTKFNPIINDILNGIAHCNHYIRISAFDIICISQKKLIPTQMEYTIILDFLYNNVNSDCTVLRLSMLKSFSNFLTQLHFMFLNVLIKEESGLDLQHLLEFCKMLQNFLVNSINLNGNYQRKIASVKLCNAVLSCLSEIPKKRKHQTRQSNITLIDYVKKKECWLLSTEEFVLKLVSLLKDPTDDVRENVIKLLLSHYTAELKEPRVMNLLVHDALKSMKSRFFYEISCGQSMFKLITNLVIKEKHSIAEYKNVEDIFYFAYNELIIEHTAKTGIMKSIETGKQLHSFLGILLVVLETCILSSYKIDIHRIMPEFVNVLENISNQFSWEEESSTSSDFSKMNEMVENIILNSEYNQVDDIDETKISGLHQMVLNCLWLNVKASCDIASILVQYNVNDASMCEKCLNIMTHVLESSRHKGAIESAGASLGRGIQFLTSLPEENKTSEVPQTLLRCKLNDLISETNKMSSITRRGAGLSIMVHRIVSSDMKRGKPLFHYFINTLLQICSTTGDSPKTKDDNIENQIDLPKAIYIHFMTKIVTDSSLASDMMFYFAKLAELAFSNLTSRHWQIRNAALQLYGALIPKQIGERKASGSDEETTATVACDELRTHSPKLWKYIMEQLRQTNGTDKVQVHSNLVPILNLLANSAKRYNFSYDNIEQKTVDEDLLNHLILLLDSPIHTVRRLTAQCIFNIYDFESIYDVLSNLNHQTENYFHGTLILLNTCYKYYSSIPIYVEKFNSLRDNFTETFSKRNYSYVCRKLLEDNTYNNIKLKDIEETLLETNKNVHIPGVHLWAEARLNKFINKCSWSEIPPLLNLLLHQSDYEKYCQFIFLKFKAQNGICREVLLEMIDTLLTFEKKYYSSIIWQILFEISLKINLMDNLDISELLKKMEGSKSIYVVRYIIPLIARNIANSEQDEKLRLMKIINKLCDFENSDVNMRYIGAIANNELTHGFDSLPDTVKVTSIKCAVMLLQDEDEDIRNLSVNFYQRLSKQEAIVQPYICLNNILNRQFLHTIFSEFQPAVQSLAKDLFETLQSNHGMDEYNPFANNSKNIYLEPNVLRQLIESLQQK